MNEGGLIWQNLLTCSVKDVVSKNNSCFSQPEFWPYRGVYIIVVRKKWDRICTHKIGFRRDMTVHLAEKQEQLVVGAAVMSFS